MGLEKFSETQNIWPTQGRLLIVMIDRDYICVIDI